MFGGKVEVAFHKSGLYSRQGRNHCLHLKPLCGKKPMYSYKARWRLHHAIIILFFYSTETVDEMLDGAERRANTKKSGWRQ